MDNRNNFIENCKFKCLQGENSQIILKLIECLEDEGYIFNGNWRDDSSSGGYNSSLELIQELGGRKNLITLRPMKKYLKVEVYWGYSRSIPIDKKPKQYYKIYPGAEVPKVLLDEIRMFYNYLNQID